MLPTGVLSKYNSCRKYFIICQSKDTLIPRQKKKLQNSLHLKLTKTCSEPFNEYEYNKTVTLKDIHNIGGKAAPTFSNDFQELVEEMKKVKGAVSIISTVKPSLNTSEPT